MYKCRNCNNELKHIDLEFWFCENCLKVIEISATKNWKNKDKIDNRFYEHKFLKHELNPNTTIENYYDFILDYMEGV